MAVLYNKENFFQVLGQISVFFATLDLFVSEVILSMCAPTSTNKWPPFNERTTLGQKLEYLEQTTQEDVSNPDVLADVHKALPEAITVSRERNRYIHDQWIFGPDDIPKGQIDRVTLVVGDGGMSFRGERITLTIQELYAFCSRIGKLQTQFAGFAERTKKSPE